MIFRRKKSEFREDKPYSGFLSHLHLTKSQRLSLLRWGLYTLMLLVLSTVQDVMLSRLRILGATTDLVPCAIFLIGVMEGSERGSVFALAASTGYLFTGSAPGVYCIVFITALVVLAAILRQSYLQKGLLAALLCVGVCLLVYELAVFGIGLFLGLTTASRIIGFLLTAGMSVLAVFILYPIAIAINRIGGEVWRE